jgi:hypothetical protein
MREPVTNIKGIASRHDLVLAATLFAHDLAALGVHALAGLGDDGAGGRRVGG